MSSRDEEALIRTGLRQQVIDRDGGCCRGCGRYVEIPHVHHIIYRSQGGKDELGNLISLDYGCHLMVHDNKRIWLPVMQQLTVTPGMSGLQLLRWYREKEKQQWPGR